MLNGTGRFAKQNRGGDVTFSDRILSLDFGCDGTCFQAGLHLRFQGYPRTCAIKRP